MTNFENLNYVEPTKNQWRASGTRLSWDDWRHAESQRRATRVNAAQRGRPLVAGLAVLAWLILRRR